MFLNARITDPKYLWVMFDRTVLTTSRSNCHFLALRDRIEHRVVVVDVINIDCEFQVTVIRLCACISCSIFGTENKSVS